MKKFNNWIKSVLIGKFTHRGEGGKGACVLDIGCGKGGDLNKWKQAKIKLYVALGKLCFCGASSQYNKLMFLDIADMSIDQARDRYVTMRNPTFEAHFFAHDCYAVSTACLAIHT